MKKCVEIPRVIIGATGSNVGKTTVVCGILQALKNRNKKILAFKCGPDYIDPMFHREILKIPSSNLDLFFTNADTVKLLIDEKNRNEYDGDGHIAIIEGVMGYYDGIGATTSDASAYDVAKKTNTSGILLVNCKGKSLSIVAEIKGFFEYKEKSFIKGVILNRISPMLYNKIKKIIEEEMPLKVLGYLPELADINIESRHLGLVTAGEIENLQGIMEKLGEIAEKTIDIDGILKISRESEKLEYDENNIDEILLCTQQNLVKNEKRRKDKMARIKIAVAMDKAFSFYYDSNLQLLEKMGAEICYFSPIKDKSLPKDISGLILGGGYPELYLQELAQNNKLKKEIKDAIENGMPCMAECGGFMYLHQSIQDENGKKYNMVGVIEGNSFPTGKLSRFGYINITTLEKTLIGDEGTKFKGHEFHYWDSENTGSSCIAQKPKGKRNWNCMVVMKNLFAGYPHIHYYSNPSIVKTFLEKSKEWKESKLH